MPLTQANKKQFTTEDIPPSPMELHKQPPNEEEEEKDDTTNKEEEEGDESIIPISRTRQEYEKVGIPYSGNGESNKRESHHRFTSGNWKRKITKITWIRNTDDEEFLDWNEKRTGKTSMQRPLEETVDHVTQYEVPIPLQRVEFDEQNEEYKTVVADRPLSVETRYSRRYSKKLLDRLLEDTVNRTTEYVIKELTGGRTYHITKKELLSANGNFAKLYNKKAGLNSTGTTEQS